MRPAIGLIFLTTAMAGLGLHAEPPCPVNSDDQRRAGYPSEVARMAKPSDTGHYIGYYVGGGSPGPLGAPRTRLEGTWGWDYQGLVWPSRINLQWYHGLFHQGGTGAYKTDGPQVGGFVK